MTDPAPTADDGRPICGVLTKADEPCQRAAGWGTDADDGPCVDHREAYHHPKKLTPEVQGTLVGAAQEGAFKKHCAQVAGVTQQTLRNWLNWGEADIEADVDSPCAELFLAFQRARGAGAVRRLRSADDEFVLERSYGYTKTERHEVDASVDIDPAEAYIQALAQANAEAEDDDTDTDTDPQDHPL